MDSQKWLLLLQTIQQEAVYAWILTVVGSTITVFYPSKETKNVGIITVVASSIIARFAVPTLINILAFFHIELNNMPLAYLIGGMGGDALVSLIRKVFIKLGSDSTAGRIYNAILKGIGLKEK